VGKAFLEIAPIFSENKRGELRKLWAVHQQLLIRFTMNSKKITVTSAKIALSCKISSQDTMTDSKVRSDGRIVFYALEIV
jgi:hypothetical protein